MKKRKPIVDINVSEQESSRKSSEVDKSRVASVLDEPTYKDIVDSLEPELNKKVSAVVMPEPV